MTQDFKELSKQYFETFSNKDIDGLSKMFDESVNLRDWTLSANGLAEVITANETIFAGVQTIKVAPTAIYQDGNTVIAEIDINVNDVTTVLVVDIITFNDDGKITSIRAYQG